MARERFFKGDTAVLEATLYDEDDGITPINAHTLNWTVKKPDGTLITGGPVTLNAADAVITVNDTTSPGLYAVQATFTLDNNYVRSLPLNFEIIDPLQTTFDSSTTIEAVIDRSWMKLEDLWDSELGGPHLRDWTKAMLDREKIARLLPDAFYGINNSYQPATGYDETTFPYDHHSPLLSQALLVETIYHLMRSYVEQPNPIGGGQLTYFDRRDYLNRWQTVLQLEQQKLDKWLDLFKRDQMGFGSTSVLIGGYSGYHSRYPRYMRGPLPFIGYRY